ncbi:hypothetical protein [Salinibacter ruber]|uniref:hypothetical protein n=1 Tax=Salinibacter ruber TaxID=146919 RepID=UPI0020737E00|nr:hypothetical protein [Salinibacter ruber]
MSDIQLHVNPDDLPPDPLVAKSIVNRAYDHNNDPLKVKEQEKKTRLVSKARQRESDAEELRQEARKLREQAKETAVADEDGAPGMLDEAQNKELKAEAAEEEAEELRSEAADIPVEHLSHDAAKDRTKKRMRADKDEWMQYLAVAFKQLEIQVSKFQAWADNLPGWARGMRVLSGGMEPTVKIGTQTCETWDQIFQQLERQGADLGDAERAARERIRAEEAAEDEAAA